MKEYNYGETGPSITFKALEGNVTIAEVQTPGGAFGGAVFTKQIKAGDLVTVAGPMSVKKAESGDTAPLIGVAVTEPYFKGKAPTGDANQGEYEPRRVTVQLFAAAVRMITLTSGNSAITPGDYLEPTSTNPQVFNKASANTRIIALESAAASSGATIAAAIGYIL